MQGAPPLVSNLPARVQLNSRGGIDITLPKGAMKFADQRDLVRALLVERAGPKQGTSFRIKHPEPEWIAEQLNGALWPLLRIHIAHIGDPQGYSRHTMEGPVPTEAISVQDQVIIHAMTLNDVTRQEMLKYPKFQEALKALGL